MVSSIGSDDAPDAVHVENSGRRYRIMQKRDFGKFRDLCFNPDDAWIEKYKSPKIKAWMKPLDGGSGKNVLKISAHFPDILPEVLYDALHEADYRTEWDKNMLKGYNICRLDTHNDIGYYLAKFPWPMSNRDYCNMRSWMVFTNGDHVIFNHSVPHSECPPIKGAVRAISLISGYYCAKGPDGVGTQLTFVSCNDLGGSIPSSLMNWALTKLTPTMMGNLEKTAKAYPEWKANHPGGENAWLSQPVNWVDDLTVDAKNLSITADQRGAATLPVAVESETGGKKKPGKKKKHSKKKDKGGHGSDADGSGTTDAEANLATVPSISFSGPPADPEVVRQLKEENERLRRKLMLAGRGERSSLAPVRGPASDDPAAVQHFRGVMQDTLDFLDRQYVQEGRVPTMREYLLRVHAILDGFKRTEPHAPIIMSGREVAGR